VQIKSLVDTDNTIQKKKRTINLLLLFIFSFLILAVITIFYAWQRSKAINILNIPIAKSSIESDLGKYLTNANFYFTPLIVQGDTLISSISGKTVLFSKTKSLSVQVRSLQLILADVTIDKDKINEIDLRFTKTILR
jgi:hypothetical protein